jgi:hypothetical protein
MWLTRIVAADVQMAVFEMAEAVDVRMALGSHGRGSRQ